MDLRRDQYLDTKKMKLFNEKCNWLELNFWLAWSLLVYERRPLEATSSSPAFESPRDLWGFQGISRG